MLKRLAIRKTSYLALTLVFVAALFVSKPARAVLTDQAFLQSCAASAGSMPVDATAPRYPVGFETMEKDGKTTPVITFNVPSRLQGAGEPQSCADLNWVKVPTRPVPFLPRLRSPFSAAIKWAGRTPINAWDCNHSTMAWAVYKKGLVSWTYMMGGFSFGFMPDQGGECRFDKTSGFPSEFGNFSLDDMNGSPGGEYRIAFFTWSHNDTGARHTGTDCPYIHCNWPARLELTGVRVPQVNDVATWLPSTGVWSVLDSATNNVITQQWGDPADKPVPGDYDNDGSADFAVFRPSWGTWFVINSSSGGGWYANYGASTDTPVPADYSGDGATDIAIRRGSSWFYLNSRTGSSHQVFIWGSSGGTAVRGNHDGDLKDDFVTFRNFGGPNGIWDINLASGGGFQTAWGDPTDIPVSGDFNGDRKTDIAVWRPSNGTWIFIDSDLGAGAEQQWGGEGDVPIPGRYDGDAATDFAVYRPSERRFYILSSTTGSYYFTDWGSSGDVPVLFNRGNWPQ